MVISLTKTIGESELIDQLTTIKLGKELILQNLFFQKKKYLHICNLVTIKSGFFFHYNLQPHSDPINENI